MLRLWGIRHIRWLYHKLMIERHYAMWSELGLLPVYRSHDEEVLLMIWRGEA